MKHVFVLAHNTLLIWCHHHKMERPRCSYGSHDRSPLPTRKRLKPRETQGVCCGTLSSLSAAVQGVNIQPEGFNIAPTGVNIQPQGASIAPTLIVIGPYDTTVAGQVKPQCSTPGELLHAHFTLY